MRTDFIMTAIKVSETGTFGKAARELYMAEANVHHQIHRLERELGFPLFVKDPLARGYVATEQGAKWLVFARRAMELLDAGAVGVRASKLKEGGK